jgi:uncharacterized RDD family membrane protein YckC
MTTPPVIYCSRCGRASTPDAQFCPQCGSDLRLAQPAAAPAPIAPAGAPAYYPSAYTPAKRYGGFSIRFIAIVIDFVVVNAIVFPVLIILAMGLGIAGSITRMPDPGIAMVRATSFFGFTTVVNWLYEALMWSSRRQATLGKMALGLRVTDLYGRRISFARASGRHFAKIISGMILLIGYIMAAFTHRHQALHDMIAGTLVEKTS